MEWPRQFEIIERIIAERLARRGLKYTLANACELLGAKVKVPKLQAWKRGQRPSADDLETLAVALGLSPAWLLLGAGKPLDEAGEGEFVPEYVPIGDTLRDLLAQLPGQLPQVAQVAGMTTAELRACADAQAVLSGLTVARLVHAYRVNANFLLAQIGQPFLTEEQYEERGPLTWLRERRGDFAEPYECAARVSLTAARLATVERTMKEAGSPQLAILNSLRAMLDGEIAKLSGVQEDCADAAGHAPQANPKKAAGGDTV